MEMGWFLFSIFATIIFGTQFYIYKRAIDSGCNRYLVMFYFMLSAAIISWIYFFINGFGVTYLILTFILATLFSIFHLTKTLGQFKALKFAPTHIVFPIVSSAVVLIVIYGLIFFNESLNLLQAIGIVLILGSIILIHKAISENKKISIKNNKGFFIALAVVVPAAAVDITNKYVATNLDIFFFMPVMYLISTIFVFFVNKNFEV